MPATPHPEAEDPASPPPPEPELELERASAVHPLAVSERRLDAALVAASVIGTAFLLLQILLYGYGRDQGIYAVVGRTLLEGGVPYRDAWDFKPPGIFVIYALARLVFGDAPIGVRVLECVGLVGTVVVMARLAQRFWSDWRIGVVAGALGVLVHAQLDFWHTAQPESFGGMLTMLGLLLGTRRGEPGAPAARERRREALALTAAGLVFGLAGLLKPPLAGGGAVLAVALGWPELRERRWGRALRPAALIAVGGALPMAVCAAWFAAKGGLGDLRETLFVFTPKYTALGWQDATVTGMLWWAITEWLVTYSSVITVGLLLLLALRPSRARVGVGLLAGVIAVQLVGVAMQGKFFPYHYGATWPATAMLAALGFWDVWERARRHLVGAALFAVAFVLVACGRSACKDVPGSYLERTSVRTRLFFSGQLDDAARDKLASVADVNARANRGAAAMIRARVPADRPVFVWGFEPVIYDLSGRRPASRFIYDVPQRVAWAKRDMREILMRDLRASPPAAIVVEHRDVFPQVTGDVLDSADTLPDFPELTELLRMRYELAEVIEDLDVYLEVPPG